MKTRRFSAPFCFRSGVVLFLALCLGLAPFAGVKAGIASHLVVNEVSIYGDAGVEDDWVEIYNPTASDISLDGWSLQKFSASGATSFTQPLSGTVAAGAYFLVVRNGVNTTQSLKDMADLLADDSFSLASDNIVYLANDTTDITPAAPGAHVIDYVGFGSASYYEGTAAAPSISSGKSLSRSPEGEDTDENSVDFILSDTPTPENSGVSAGQDLEGDVLVTITPDAEPVRNIMADSATVVFQVNADGTANVEYGPDNTYGNTTADAAVTANTDVEIDLAGLACGTDYHYRINAADTAGTDTDQTADAVFTTMPCGISVDSLTMTRSGAKANDDYPSGWEWEYNITVWNTAETSLKMKFNAWTGPAALEAGGNMRYSVDNGATWTDISASGAYPATGADISAIDNSADTGRQVTVLVQMKVPAGTLAGHYGSSYGILTE